MKKVVFCKEKFLVRNDNGATILSCPNCKEELQIFFGEPLKSESTCSYCGTKLYYKNPHYEELVKEYEKEE